MGEKKRGRGDRGGRKRVKERIGEWE